MIFLLSAPKSLKQSSVLSNKKREVEGMGGKRNMIFPPPILHPHFIDLAMVGDGSSFTVLHMKI